MARPIRPENPYLLEVRANHTEKPHICVGSLQDFFLGLHWATERREVRTRPIADHIAGDRHHHAVNDGVAKLKKDLPR